MSLLKKELVASNQYEIEFSVEKEVFEAAVTAVYKKQVKKISVPGFRPGKAPKHIIERMYGKGVFYDDAINEVLPAAYEAAVVAMDALEVDQVETPSDTDPRVTVDTTWSFNTADTTEAENYYIVKETAQKNVVTYEKLILDATTGKIAPRAQQWAQFTNGAVIKFEVPAASKVIVKCYTNDYTVNGVVASGTAQSAQEFEVKAGWVTIVSSSDSNYIDYISVKTK
jgi:FKBP-type peptidyl-prolyl cis-trans isomerase (trigger factor)